MRLKSAETAVNAAARRLRLQTRKYGVQKMSTKFFQLLLAISLFILPFTSLAAQAATSGHCVSVKSKNSAGAVTQTQLTADASSEPEAEVKALTVQKQKYPSHVKFWVEKVSKK